jgi:hypothetical protein
MNENRKPKDVVDVQSVNQMINVIGNITKLDQSRIEGFFRNPSMGSSFLLSQDFRAIQSALNTNKSANTLSLEIYNELNQKP